MLVYESVVEISSQLSEKSEQYKHKPSQFCPLNPFPHSQL